MDPKHFTDGPGGNLGAHRPPQRGNGSSAVGTRRPHLGPCDRYTDAAARQRCRGRRARAGVHRGVGADLLDVLRRPLVDDLLPEVGREAFGLNCGSLKGQRSREVCRE